MAATGSRWSTSTSGWRLDRGRRETFKVCLSYYGPSFEGWAWAKERQRTVAGELDRALRAVSVKGKHRQVNINGAGRTDKGVSACGQVFSFTTWDEPQPAEVLATINRIASDQLCAWAVQRVPNSFHATFQSTWRRYIYLFPLRTSAAPNAALLPQHPAAGSSAERTDAVAAQQACDSSLRSRTPVICPHTGLDLASVDGLDVRTEDVDRLLRQLEGQKLNCTAYARDTPKGKDCSCHILTARASQVMLPGLDGQPGTPAVCIELVANRFLRKMVRVLAATAIREAVPAGAMVHEPQAPDQALVRLAQKLDRVLTAPFAPAVGLCFAGAGYPGSAVPA
ncbi:hypothetical protein WJX72_005650 [[Myrmecia] bisecta]|uniref:Uncharacterized protein n=1 Tax=[Myrmecia] bisecta TaxID=41462 RepID=A0AAW1R708_9CHLO